MGKGDKPRPILNRAEYSKRWDETFGGGGGNDNEDETETGRVGDIARLGADRNGVSRAVPSDDGNSGVS